MKSAELIEFSNNLFDELLKQFENIYVLLNCPVDGVVTPDSEAQFSKEEFIVLLRYCLMMLQFLEFDTSLLWEKYGVIFKILGRVSPPTLVSDSHEFSSITTKNSFSRCFSYSFGDVNEESNQLLNFFSLILEVFIAEFSENVTLRKHLILFSVSASNTEKSRSCRSTHTDTCTVLELVSSHFLLFVKNGLAFNRFLHLLSGSSEIDNMTPVISVDASLELLSTPFVLSAPHILQAHLILLASRCISTHLAVDGRKSDNPVMSFFINPLELSVKLYLFYLSTMQLDDAILGTNVRSNLGVMSPFSHPIMHIMTWGELTHQVIGLGDFSHLHSMGVLSGTKSEVLAYSATYVHGNHPLIDQLCKEATCLVVDYMIENILPSKLWDERQNENKVRLPNEVYCLAAAMNLMNSSLLHIICHLTTSGFHEEMKLLRDCSCTTSECLSQSASILGGCGADPQVQKFLSDLFGAYDGMHLDIKFTLAHFSSLLVFSFRRKIDFLWKGCISMMMTLMNLLLFEERKLGLSKLFDLLQNHPKMDNKGLNCRSTSVMIAGNLEKTRMLYIKNEIQYTLVDDNRNRGEADQHSGIRSAEGIRDRKVHGTEGNACDWQSFTECIPSFRRNPLQWEDLAGFIECCPEKDYYLWLNNRNKFNKWKRGRKAVLKCRKRKRMTSGIAKDYNLRTKTGAGERIEVKSQELSGVERIKDRASAAVLADPSGPEGVDMSVECMPEKEKRDCSELKDLTPAVECGPEAEKQGKAGRVKHRRRTFVIVKGYNLRRR